MIRHRTPFVLFALAGIWLLAAIAGCGGGGLSLTGGSVPIGTSKLRGVVVRADDINQPVPGAALTLSVGDKQSTDVSDQAGSFDFGSIVGGQYSCAIEPPSGSGLRDAWVWYFSLPDDTPAQMVAALWPAGFDPNTVKRVSITPDQYTLRVGETIRFVPTAYDSDDQPLSIRPSLLLEGDLGTLAVGGQFTAAKVGQGEIIAWLNGRFAVAQVKVIP
jgi:hypothetical protein